MRMNSDERHDAAVLHELQERAKELNCIYRVDEILNQDDLALGEVFGRIAAALPPAWQYPQECQARITFEGLTIQPPDFQGTPWTQTAKIIVQGQEAGAVEVSYKRRMPGSDEGPFLKEERKLIDTVAGRIAAALEKRRPKTAFEHADHTRDGHWRWRLRMAQSIAAQLDPERFGVKTFGVIGSTKNATAGPASDIDLLLHFRGSEEQRKALMLWLEGWSRCLSEINFMRTGCRADGLLDVHLVSDEDIAARSSFAVKLDATTDAARRLPMGQNAKR